MRGKMAETIAIMAETGHGKTHSIKYLNPDETVLVNADGKSPTFGRWKLLYNKEKKNYFETSNPETVRKIISGISTNPEYSYVKHIVIDTVNGIMLDDEMKRMREKGYDKWVDLAYSVYDIITLANKAREDLIIFFMFHVQDLVDEVGNHFYRIQTSGRKLEKIKLESKFPVVLYGKCEYGEQNKYYFETQANYSTAKSPEGMFNQKTIPNNLKIVADAVRKHSGALELENNQNENKQGENNE